MPMVLGNISRFDSNRWKSIQNELITFGKASGLFQDISVRKLGNSSNDPFQLQVKARGPKVNIIDVGYGREPDIAYSRTHTKKGKVLEKRTKGTRVF